MRRSANCLPTEAPLGRAITPGRLMPQVPFYIPVLSQGFVSLHRKKHCQQPGYSQGGGRLLGKQRWYKPHLLRATVVLKKEKDKERKKTGLLPPPPPHVPDFKTSRGSQHTNHSESRAGTKCQLHTSQAQRNTVSTFATTNKNESRHPSKAE